MNPDFELMRLKNYLSSKNWAPAEIDSIMDVAARDINEVILDIIAETVAEATDYAASIGAEEFIEELDVAEVGGSFMILTRSGKTDFSIPELKMLPHLLKNAKEGENGKYKVIPVGSKKTSYRNRDIFSVLRQRDSMIKEARASLIESNLDKRSARAQQMASTWRTTMATRIQERLSMIKREAVVEPSQQVEFRTASEKQDPETSWVIPARDMDMTGYLMDLNKSMQDLMSRACTQIVEASEREFA